jgi:hypothetical protein
MSETENQRLREAIAKDCRAELDACRSLLDFALADLAAWSGRPIKRGADRMIIAETVRATKTLGAVVPLCEAGYGEQALMLDRSLFEGMAVAHWVNAHRRRAVWLFTRHERFSRFLWHQTLDALGWLDGGDDRKSWPSVGPKQRKELEKLFGRYGTNSWWRMTVPKLLEDTEDQWDAQGRKNLWEYHNVVYRLSNQVLHSTATSVSGTFIGQTSDALTMTAGPSNQLVGPALYAAHWTYGQTYTLLIDVFKLPSGEAFRELWQHSGKAFDTADAVGPS